MRRLRGLLRLLVVHKALGQGVPSYGFASRVWDRSKKQTSVEGAHCFVPKQTFKAGMLACRFFAIFIWFIFLLVNLSC